MAITNAQISSYIAKAQRAQEAGMLTIVDGKRSGKKGDSLYFPMRFLSAGVDVLTSNHGLTNAQIEIIIQEMIEQGNLNDFSGDPIPYLTNNIILPSSLGIKITDLIDGPHTGGGLTSWPGYYLRVKPDGSAWEFIPPPSGSVTTQEGIVAYAGGGQLNATPLTALYNYVDTVATINDSVKLTSAVIDAVQEVQNSSSPSAPIGLAWFPTYISGGPQIGIYINGLEWIGTVDFAVDLNTTMANLVTSVNTNTSLGTIPLLGFPFDNSAGFIAAWNIGLQSFSIVSPDSIGGSLNGQNIQFAYNGGSMGGGAGSSLTFFGGISACDMDVYPSSGESIYGLSVDAPMTISVGSQVKFVCAATGVWRIT